MNIKKITTTIITATVGTTLLALLVATPANAATISTTRLPGIITKSDAAIAKRDTSLNALIARIAEMKNVSASTKTTLSNEVQTNISGLATLKAKIDADTDVATAATDAKSIYGSFRIYALVIPQGYITAASDRVQTIVPMIATISTKLQTRITADQTAGKDVTALQASLSDLNAKIADANTQAQTAQSGVVSLTPDQGNKTILASNTASLKASRADIKVATSDLATARADAKSIIAGL